MGSDTPEKGDCRDVLDEVYLYLDLECNEDRRQLIRTHLDECTPCLREFGIEQEVKAARVALLRRRDRAGRAPRAAACQAERDRLRAEPDPLRPAKTKLILESARDDSRCVCRLQDQPGFGLL